MRRGFAIAAALLTGAAAHAHPMGALSTNRSALLVVRPEATIVRYTVDFAEVPSAAEPPADDLDAWATERMAGLLPGIRLTVDDRPAPLAVERCFGSEAPGDGGLPTRLMLCTLRAEPVAAGRIALSDGAFAESPGWREMRIVVDGVPVGDAEPPGAVASGDVLLPFSAPEDLLALDAVSATVGVPGPLSTLTALRARAPDALAGLLTGELSPGFVALALLSAVGLGVAHALSPGHGKTAVAAWLVGSRGTVRHAVLLGVAVTAAHLSSVLVVGALTMGAAQLVDAGALYPWVGLMSGAAIMGVGCWLLVSGARAWRARPRGLVITGAHVHGGRGGWLPHTHPHPEPPAEASVGGLLVLGATWGMVPCPSALVVLLAAIGMHRELFGAALVAAFSLGLAGVLVAVGVAVVRARDLLGRLGLTEERTAWIPVASAMVVVALGAGVVAEAARELGWLG